MQRQRDELVPVAEVLSDLPFLECEREIPTSNLAYSRWVRSLS